MDTLAVVFDQPRVLEMRRLSLPAPTSQDVVVDVEWTGISVGTERLLWTGRMPPFPGLSYPLVPGYEAVGRVVMAGAASGRQEGERVFVAGARCYGHTQGLWGAAASRVVVPGTKVILVADHLEERGILLALAATAYHAIRKGGGELPGLIVGHGTFGRLLARLTVILGGGPGPTVWESQPARRSGGDGYVVTTAEDDDRRDYRTVYDASGDASLIEPLLGRLQRGGEVVLAGFYSEPIAFRFPLAFMREARLRVAAEWEPDDLKAVTALVNAGTLGLGGLITHRHDAREAAIAYRTAFDDPTCVKMILDWRQCA